MSSLAASVALTAVNAVGRIPRAPHVPRVGRASSVRELAPAPVWAIKGLAAPPLPSPLLVRGGDIFDVCGVVGLLAVGCIPVLVVAWTTAKAYRVLRKDSRTWTAWAVLSFLLVAAPEVLRLVLIIAASSFACEMVRDVPSMVRRAISYHSEISDARLREQLEARLEMYRRGFEHGKNFHEHSNGEDEVEVEEEEGEEGGGAGAANVGGSPAPNQRGGGADAFD